ncbi:hypothetical protein PISMIDRAFT_683588 [Pisolithus microcarpus 441]|uniref:Uncharacterized protein n=1 Tax=Pisolithus microcarpus 441 TaxID=765257 RepID=A0A0C9ZGF1_9AGAM|nr:hypothetical protein PISMIDRAFT_685963 [Pisolithus microcarpus 441]KIK19033.1 hypothetical protein PISMIDRAFT_683588 [Pisolithus microcarpus 441]
MGGPSDARLYHSLNANKGEGIRLPAYGVCTVADLPVGYASVNFDGGAFRRTVVHTGSEFSERAMHQARMLVE